MKRALAKLLAEQARRYDAVLKHVGRDPAYALDEGDMPETKVEVENDGEWTRVRIQGVFDDWFGFDPHALISQLDEINPQKLEVLIESPGGYVDLGLAMYNDLRGRIRDGVTVRTEARGIVASAAAVTFLAAEERVMTTGTQLMIHDPWIMAFVSGDADAVEKRSKNLTNVLRATEVTLRDIMTERTGNSRREINQWLKDETYFSPSEALDKNFATKVLDDSSDDDEDREANAQALRLFDRHFFGQVRQEIANAA